MPFVRFQDLKVYNLAEELADTVWSIVVKWGVLARDTVGKQLIRAADSISANIAEGSGRHSPADNRRFVRIARGSLHETQNWLRRAFKRKLITPDETASLHGLIEQLAPALNGYLASIGRPPRGGPAKNAPAPDDVSAY
ncbi:four helix bundle protein [Gemmata sp.]|uniref:four helix bundle protein n=1 Tax=Gemmata sp. TaxID=1914242 RepID=UPI003F6FF199